MRSIIFFFITFVLATCFAESVDGDFDRYCRQKIKTDVLQAQDENLVVALLFNDEQRAVYILSLVDKEARYFEWLACYKDADKSLEFIDQPF